MSVVIGAGSFVLFLSLAVNVVALLVPYWVNSGGGLGPTSGLWGTCTCSWKYDNIQSIVQKNNDDAWFIACQWLYAVGVLIMAVVMLVLFMCTCCSGKSHQRTMIAAGVLMIIAAIAIAICLILFGVFMNKDYKVGITTSNRFLWGFWLGVAGFAMALISAIVFLAQSRRLRKDYN